MAIIFFCAKMDSVLPSKGRGWRVPASRDDSLEDESGRPAKREEGRGGREREDMLASAPYTGTVDSSTTFSKNKKKV